MHNGSSVNRVDEKSDEQFISLAQRFVSAYNDFVVATRKYGPLSDEANQAWHIVLIAERKYKRKAAYERKRNSSQTPT